MSSKITGAFGEDYTVQWLQGQGAVLLERNYHSRFGEIDIIAKSGPYLLFVEVKTRSTQMLDSPGASVTVSKQKKIMKTALVYLSEKSFSLQPRFDVMELTVKTGETLSVVRENYIKNAFEWEGEYAPF